MTERQQRNVRVWRTWFPISVASPTTAKRWLETLSDEEALPFARRWFTSTAAKVRIERGRMAYQRRSSP